MAHVGVPFALRPPLRLQSSAHSAEQGIQRQRDASRSSPVTGVADEHRMDLTDPLEEFRRRYDRLARLLHLVEPLPRAPLADAGCDHALLSLAAVLTGVSRHVVAIDQAEEPLRRAYRHITALQKDARVLPGSGWPQVVVKNWEKPQVFSSEEEEAQYCTSDAYFELRLGSGAHVLHEGELLDGGTSEQGTVVVAGVGVRTMLREILSGCVRAGAGRLLLQPTQSTLLDLFLLREALESSGWSLEKEDLCFSRGRFYASVFATAGHGAVDPSLPRASRVLSGSEVPSVEIELEKNLLFGRLRVDADEMLFRAYLTEQRAILEKAALKARQLRAGGYSVNASLQRQAFWVSLLPD
eukprot:scaffold10_cov257-Pinguiococcus_pyrenoidosus.AAC.62